jgi:predicted alpha-1,2-mannosidase
MLPAQRYGEVHESEGKLMSRPVDDVNVRQGTASTIDFSTGNTLPLMARPWGRHHWTLQTAAPRWLFHPDHRRLWGLRLTHQPSPWIGDYSSLLLLPFHGESSDLIEHQASAYELSKSTLQPHYLRTELLRYGISLEMTPTDGGAILRFSRRKKEPLRLRFHFDGAHEISFGSTQRLIRGLTWDFQEGAPVGFGLSFMGELSVPAMALETNENGACLTFAAEVESVELRLAGSWIDEAMAQTALQRELTGKTLEQVRDEGAAVWNGLLSRFVLEGEDASRQTFYSCLYRCLLFPRFLDEVDEQGKAVHYSPYDGKIHEGALCTDSGFWDTYRTLYPLLALAYPDVLHRMLQGWVNASRQAGWTPKWASPGLRNCMIGTHFDVVAADAIAKGLTAWGVEEAFAYLWKDATVPSDDGAYGRRELAEYIRLGYVPSDQYSYAVSATLDYAYDDFCVAEVAKFLGRSDEEKILRQRALNYRNVFDPQVGFMRAKRADGTWDEFREFAWGGPYIEGGPWQHAFNVPHDPEGLAALLGGKEALIKKLDLMLSTLPDFEVGSYGFEIHEMTEMAAAGFGQYAQSNQPVHAFLFLYALMGEAAKTTQWVHQVAHELYGPNHLPGDEDNGEMAAWYIWACLGLFPACPGTADYVRFEPFHRELILRVPGKAPLKAGQGSGAVVSHQSLAI